MHTLIHISDLHIGYGSSPKPVDKVVAAIKATEGVGPSATLVVTGDIVYSGASEQYDIAAQYLSDLRTALGKGLKGPCELVVCPGNHDCEHPEDSAVRDVVVEKIRADSKLPTSQRMIEECVGVQGHFFRWAESIGSLGRNNRADPLSWIIEQEVSQGRRIGFRVVNTAWMSTNPEIPGALFFAPSRLQDPQGVEVCITLLHHPFNWFQPPVSRELRSVLESKSDLILTGHEHDVDSYEVVRQGDGSVCYVNGGLFSGGKAGEGEFNLVQIDFDLKKYRVLQFAWEGERFSGRGGEIWAEFLATGAGASDRRVLSESWEAHLSDLGIPLSHPAKDLTLEDIFIAPDLKSYEESHQAPANGGSIIQSENCLNRLLEDRYVFLLGEDQSGKTTLAKQLFSQTFKRGKTPVLLAGSSIRAVKEPSIRKVILRELRTQYQVLDEEEFWQLPSDERVAIVDDFHRSQLNTAGRKELASYLRGQFGAVYLLGRGGTQVEDVIASSSKGEQLEGFQRYEVRPYGHYLRDRLIKRWLVLGREQSIDNEKLEYEIRHRTNIVNSVIGKSLVPKFPLYVLLLLQQLESEVPLETPRSGSYGYFYEVLVTLALNKTSKSPEDVDMKYTFLSELAWWMFSGGRRQISDDELLEFCRSHIDAYSLNVEPKALKREMIASRMLQLTHGNYDFAPRFSLYYFVARHLRDTQEDVTSQQCLIDAVANIHREDYANILIFYTYLTKSKNVIDQILVKARDLFSSVEPCNMSDHVSFISALQAKVMDIVLEDGDTTEHRRAALRERDASAEEAEDETREANDTSGDDEDLLLLSTNSAIKTLQVLGQILRNFSGSFRRELKLEITKECFGLGLRLLNAFYSSLEEHLEAVIPALADLFGKDLLDESPQKREDEARQFVFMLTEVMSLATLRRISQAVGAESLVRTYKDLEEETEDTRATRFVQLCLRLDHCKSFPTNRVVDLHRDVHKDVFGLTLLRMLVAEHFYFYERPYRTRQSISSKIGLRFRPGPADKRRQKALPPST